MTPDLAKEYIFRRMKDLGIEDYYLRFRHFAMQPGEKINEEAHNQFYILVHEIDEVSISSDFGFYDLSDPNINEQSYEHQGSISIINNSQIRIHVRFIQIIPKN